jgi:hypothetical protein
MEEVAVAVRCVDSELLVVLEAAVCILVENLGR